MRRLINFPRAEFFTILSVVTVAVLQVSVSVSSAESTSDTSKPQSCRLEIITAKDKQEVFDLSKLRDWSPWLYVFDNKGVGALKKYEFNICGRGNHSTDYPPVDDPCQNSSVCNITADKRLSFSEHEELMEEHVTSYSVRGLMLSFWGPSCEIHRGRKMMSIHVSCGQHLGYPQLILESRCSSTFGWTTSAACSAPPKREEVPCYTHDQEGNLYDLTSLILSKGAYQVQTMDRDETFFINVCSNIVPDSESGDCPESSASCYKQDQKVYSTGKLKSRLSYVKDHLQLEYEEVNSNRIIPGCDSNPKTVIHFRCPKQGMAKAPLLISSLDCYYEVEWETQHACPLSSLKGNLSTCSFNREQHGVSIDLSPLKKIKEAIPYILPAKLNGTDFEFLLNICGGISQTKFCNSGFQSTSVCLRTKGAVEGKFLCRMSASSSLKYVDGQATLTYEGLGSCPRNNQTPKVIIHFKCNETADNNGIGIGKFILEDECTYVFEWPTKYACAKKYEPTCTFNHGLSHFNLASISSATGNNIWEVIDSLSNKNQIKEIYLNLCGDVNLLKNQKKCPEGSLICMIDKKVASNLGSFMKTPTYNDRTGKVEVLFTNGEICSGGKFRQTKLMISCAPGQITNSPELLHLTGCEAEIEWSSAAACPLLVTNGTNCTVFDENLGLLIDLSALKSPSSYKMKSLDHTYHINVCSPVNVNGCPADAGGCQIENSDKRNKGSWSLGKAASSLMYRDGFVSLVYTGGTPYRDPKKTPRTMTIAFLCDPNAGPGTPEFEGEADRSYSFRWATSYACPKEVSVNCMVVDPEMHRQYDLSSLTKSSGNWEVMDAEGKRKFYLNVCRPINNVDSCKSQSAACAHTLDKGKVVATTNLGQSISRPKISSDGHLQLHYISGDGCISYGQRTNYSVTINFICHKGSQTEGPHFLGLLGTCQFSFLWATQASCPIGDEKEKECRFKDPVSGTIFDLMPLRKSTYYELNTQGRKFQLNICGAVGGEGCPRSDASTDQIAVCEMNGDGKSMKTTLGLADSQMLHTSANGPIRLTYFGEIDSDKKVSKQNNKFFTHTDIHFECSNTNDLRFLKQENETYYFTFATPLVCVPDQVDCDVVFGDLEYDLNALVNNNSRDWVVERKTGSDVEQFFLSFCNPLTGVAGIPCHGAGICKLNPSGGSSKYMSLGKQQRPQVKTDGTILIEYKGGSQCPGQQKATSAQVILHCSSALSEPRLLTISPECNYVFSLHTPAACPITVFKGSNCLVTDRVYGHTFDLSPLRQQTDYRVKVDNYTYLLNVCGALHDAPDGCEGSAICQTKDTDKTYAVSTGKPSEDLTLRDGLIELVYQNGKPNCHGSFNRSTILSFYCDHTRNGYEEGPSFISEEDDCTYVFKWTTHLACPPHTITSCYAEDGNGLFYDLSGLSLPHDNYVVTNPFNKRQKFLLNVCRSLVFQSDQMCSYGSTACMIDKTDANPLTRATSIGGSLNSPQIIDGKLQLHYTMGTLCASNSKKRYETVIDFHCDPYAKKGQPELINVEGCSFNFLWRSAAACPVEEMAKSTGHCTTINPTTGYVFNLTALSLDKTGHTVSSGGEEFLLNICSDVGTSSCIRGVGSCLTMQRSSPTAVNAGKANGLLMYSRGNLYLNYSNGERCPSGYGERSTIITFECSIKDLGPVLLSEPGNCTYFFNWNTPLACETRPSEDEEDKEEVVLKVPCVVHTANSTLDLSPLMQQDTAFHALDINKNFGIYGINVCKSLVGFLNTGLHSPAAVCSLCFGATKPLSLGTLWKPPYMDENDKIMLDYVNGSTCLKNPNKRYSSKITFICDVTDEDGLQVVDVDEENCVVFFELSTSLACIDPEFHNFCTFADKKSGYRMELSELENSGKPFQVLDGKDKYLLSVCQVVKPAGVCENSAVCHIDANGQEKDFGMVRNASLFHNGVHLSVVYHTSEPCTETLVGTQMKQSEIKFYCNPSNGVGSPQLYKKTDCSTIFLWPTAAVCHLDHPPCTLFSNDQLFDLRELSSISHSWSARNSKDNHTYWLNICKEVHPSVIKRFHNTTCPTYSSICKVDSINNTSSLGNILTQRLHYNKNLNVLTLTYDHGDSLCAPIEGSNVSLKGQTEIDFKCGTQVGSPIFVSGPDSNCRFKFSWTSSIACPEASMTRISEGYGILVDQRLKENDFFINMSSILNITFTVKELYRESDNFNYSINIKGGVGQKVGHPECANAAVCQFKPDGSFYRDIGTVGTSTFYLKGNDLRLIITSLGKKCGKNKSKNVTSIIKFQCATGQDLGTPVFEYESNNCDYIFNWDTNAVCPQSPNRAGFFGGVHVQPAPYSKTSSEALSTPSIVGIVFIVLTALLLVLVLARKERRNYMKLKIKGCFHNIHLPCYRYREFQCYFLRGSGSLNSQIDGEAVLLAPHEPFPKYPEESDSEPIA